MSKHFFKEVEEVEEVEEVVEEVEEVGYQNCQSECQEACCRLSLRPSKK